MLNFFIRYTLLIGLQYLCTVSSWAVEENTTIRQRISLHGAWGFRIDSSGIGVQNCWMDSIFSETVSLPGTMALWGKGIPFQQATTSHLNSLSQYTGVAWYQRRIHIPESWRGKDIYLYLERTKVTSVWIDDVLVGSSSILSAPQSFKLPDYLAPGWHTITICVNNNPKLVHVGGSHAISEHTQTNWNGIIGAIYLEAVNKERIEGVKVYTDINSRKAFIKVIGPPAAFSKANKLQVSLYPFKNTIGNFQTVSYDLDNASTDSICEIVYSLDNNVQLWSEYNPALYRLSISLLKGGVVLDEVSIITGFRSFKAKGTRFAINDIVTFLRGKNESCVFPLTGFPPTTVEEWQRIYRIAKSYGINHYRFHSYTPPKAAFEAADIEGIYIHAELPNWSDFKEGDTLFAKYQLNEGKAIIDAYGNHPSFVMLSLGNELAGDEIVHNRLVSALKHYDGGRRLYAFGTNAFYNNPHPGQYDDFWTTMRTGKETDNGLFDVRGSFATTEDLNSGILNHQYPNTTRNFSEAIRGWHLPIISHEMGQYQVYPNYAEIPKYTGVLKPLNMQIFKERLQKAGMLNQADSFFKASGMLTAQLYRREIEMALATPGLAGFQLLDLQDFPGQGTALVGLLDAFMESKGLIEPSVFRQSCNDITLQVCMDRFVWTNDELFRAKIQVINFSPQNVINKKIQWLIVDEKKRVLATDTTRIFSGKDSNIHVGGDITFVLKGIRQPSQLEVRVKILDTDQQNAYPLWVYPSSQSLDIPPSVIIAESIDEQIKKKLLAGSNVLLFPRHDMIESKSVGGQYISEFWNWKVFKEGAVRNKRPVSAGTLGILTNPQHPLFKYFPTDFYTSWQWWSIVKNARPFILDTLPKAYRPLVQVIDNIDRNHKLGLIWEVRVGKGGLLVCMAPLNELQNDPAARQLYYSILKYMDSADFNPTWSIDIKQLETIL